MPLNSNDVNFKGMSISYVIFIILHLCKTFHVYKLTCVNLRIFNLQIIFATNVHLTFFKNI